MKTIIKNNALCIGCGVCESTCSESYFKVTDKNKSCIRISSQESGFSVNVCSQCGVCVNECQPQALKRDARGVVRLNKKDCVGCLICVGYCPEGAMMQQDDLLEPFKCIACGLCVKSCPTGAITIQEA